MVICLERGTNDLRMVQLMPLSPIISCFIKIQTSLTFLVPAYPSGPGKEAIEWMSVVSCLPILTDLVSLTIRVVKTARFF